MDKLPEVMTRLYDSIGKNFHDSVMSTKLKSGYRILDLYSMETAINPITMGHLLAADGLRVRVLIVTLAPRRVPHKPRFWCEETTWGDGQLIDSFLLFCGEPGQYYCEAGDQYDNILENAQAHC